MSDVLFTTSWDDGSAHDLRVAQLLTDRGLTGTFYASTGPTGHRSISGQSLQRIGDLHELGIHGRTHVLFTQMSERQLSEEVEWARHELEPFGQVSRVVAPPRGRTDHRVDRLLAGLGYAVRSAPILGSSRTFERRLEPTFQLLPHNTWRLARNVARRRLLPATPLLLAWLRGRDFGRRVGLLLESGVASSSCAHIWGHADEIDRLDLWPVLTELLDRVTELPVEPVNNTQAYEYLRGNGRSP
jgi:peptidoglycan/xylan/chitin deacetylase (PgdA/CDA1 family)